MNSACKEPSQTTTLFGICDDQNGTKAYTDTANNTKWIATVINDNARQISFTAIDNCIVVLKPGTKDKESSCDGMLTFPDNLILVELKDQGTGGWITRAIDQLENTIKLIQNNHDLSSIKFKKAFACNKKHPHFTTIDNEQNKTFFSTYGFRLDIQAEIVIK